MIPILYESSEQSFTSLGIGALAEAISCEVKTVLNGQFELEMTYPISGKRYPDIQISRIIKAKGQKGGSDQLFDIYAISKPINGIVAVYASHVSGRKQYIPVMPCNATSIQPALIAIADNVAEANPFTLWSDKTTSANFNLKVPASLGQVLGGMAGSLLDVYGGEYEFDNFTIKLWNRRGQDNGVSLRYGKNITTIEQEESIASTITGICPFWSDLDGNLVTLSEKSVDSPNASNFPFKRTVVKDFSTDFSEKPTEAQLKTRAQAYITSNNIGIPSVGIDVSYENLADYEEFKDVALLEEVKLGDTVHVYFEPLEITATARVTETYYNVLLDKYKKIRVGSVKTNLSNVINNVANEASQEVIDSSNVLETAFNNAIELLSGADGGNVIINRNPTTNKPYEILIMDTDNVNTATNVLRLNMNGLGYSANGINGPYSAAITGAGIVATAITTGTLNADLIRAGTLSSIEIIGEQGTIGGWTMTSEKLGKSQSVTPHTFNSLDLAVITGALKNPPTITEEQVLADYPWCDVDGDGHITKVDLAIVMAIELNIIPNGTITQYSAYMNSNKPYGLASASSNEGAGFSYGVYGAYAPTYLGKNIFLTDIDSNNNTTRVSLDSSGLEFNAGGKIPNNKILTNLASVSSQNGTQFSLATATWKDSCSMSLSANKTYLINGIVSFASDNSGYRRVVISDTADSSTPINQYGNVVVAAVDGLATRANVTMMYRPSAATTIHLNVYQNSGSSLNTTGYLQAMIIEG